MSDLLHSRNMRSTGSSFNTRILDTFRAALQEAATLWPEALVPAETHVVVHPDSVSDDGHRLDTTTDPWVLEFRTSAGALLDPAAWVPPTDGTWDGIMHLEITDPDGTVHRRQSRHWWLAPTQLGGPPYTWYVSLDRPWRNSIDTGMEFRIHQPEVWFSAGVVGPRLVGRVFDDSRQQVAVVSAADALSADAPDYRGQYTSIPSAIWPGRSFSLSPIRTAPAVSFPGQINGLIPWLGPVQEGDFQFYATVAWGYTDAEWGNYPGGIRRPVWESPPSPISAVASHTANPGGAIRITTTNPEAMINFWLGAGANLRETHSGLRIRIYVLRTSVRTAGLGVLNQVDADSIPYLLTEILPSQTTPEASFTWNGSVVPDGETRLPSHTAYRAWKLWEHPDARYEIDFSVYALPDTFWHGSDVVPIEDDAVPFFQKLLLANLSVKDGNDLVAAEVHRTDAMRFKAAATGHRRAGSDVVRARRLRSGVSNVEMWRRGDMTS